MLLGICECDVADLSVEKLTDLLNDEFEDQIQVLDLGKLAETFRSAAASRRRRTSSLRKWALSTRTLGVLQETLERPHAHVIEWLGGARPIRSANAGCPRYRSSP